MLAPTELGQDGLPSVGVARLPLGEALAVSFRDVHPPLSFLLLSGWLTLAGPSFLAARWLPVAESIVALALLTRLVAGFWDRPAGLVAAGLLAISPVAIYQGATPRDYTAGMCVTLVTWLMIRSKRRGLAWSALLAVFTGAGLLIWFMHWISLLLQLLLTRRRDQLIALIVGGLLAAPWYLAYVIQTLALLQVRASGAVPEDRDAVQFAVSVASAFIGVGPTDVGSGVALALLAGLVSLIAFGLWLCWRNRGLGSALVLLAGLAMSVALAAAFAFLWSGTEFIVRYLLPAAPFAIVPLAIALRTIRPRMIPMVTAATLLAGTLLFYRSFHSLPSEQSGRSDSLDLLRRNLQPGDRVVISNLDDLGYLSLTAPATDATAYISDGPLSWQDPSYEGELAFALDSRDTRVWWVRNKELPEIRSEQFVGALLAERAPIAQIFASHRVLQAFGGQPAWQQVNATFSNGMQLRRISVPAQVASGSEIPVVLEWTTPRQLDDDYTVFVHIVDSAGIRIGQHDGPPAEGAEPTSIWKPGTPRMDMHFVPTAAGTRPGRYKILVGVYDSDGVLSEANGTDRLQVAELDVAAAM
jgi:hypothetical protein